MRRQRALLLTITTGVLIVLLALGTALIQLDTLPVPRYP